MQDYCRLNEHTICNRYPLPLIPELIARAQDAALFSKFDVRWGYNNVRIKKQDQWKAAFIMNCGGGMRNLKTHDCGKLMSPCHTLSHPRVTRYVTLVTHDRSCDNAHGLARDLKPEDTYDWLEDS
jgi:hypothetical protein